MSDTKPYQENENFVPEPTAQFGTLDTSGTAGAAHARLEEVSPVFDVAAKQNAVQAAKALDPKDDSVPESTVILPDNNRTREDAVKQIKEKGKEAEKSEPTLLTERKTASQKEAEQTGKEGEETAQRQQASQGAAGGSDGSGTGETRSSDDDKDGGKTAKKSASSNR